ncbi:MAG: Lysophospholipase [Labilithrix sp.]|nr:Lysophospholipase [Labilithrix sp.]
MNATRAVATSLALASITLAASCAESRAPPSGQRAPATPSTSTPRYLALGDSFTIGTGSTPSQAFPARLVERWRASGCAVALENVAVNGYTSSDVIERELPSIASYHPTFVTVAVGANDIVRGTSIEAYGENVRRILDAAKAGGARVVVLPQPDWSRSPAAASFGMQPALAASIAAFNDALAAEARAKGAEWVDLVALMQKQASRSQLAGDGLHPSSDAYDEWSAELARVLASPCAS